MDGIQITENLVNVMLFGVIAIFIIQSTRNNNGTSYKAIIARLKFLEEENDRKDKELKIKDKEINTLNIKVAVLSTRLRSYEVDSSIDVFRGMRESITSGLSRDEIWLMANDLLRSDFDNVWDNSKGIDINTNKIITHLNKRGNLHLLTDYIIKEHPHIELDNGI